MVDQPVTRQLMVLPDLSRLQRWTVGLGGLASFALGTVAVFHTTNSLGAGVLLIVGALALLCALLGYIPRMGFGGNSIDPGREPAPDAVEGVEWMRLALREVVEESA